MRYINYSLQLKCKYRKKKKKRKTNEERKTHSLLLFSFDCFHCWPGLAWLACLGQVKHLAVPSDPRELDEYQFEFRVPFR